MSYATLQDLIDRFKESEIIQLTDEAGAGVVDPAPVVLALADADAEINAALVGRYSLPLGTVPDLLVRIASDLARESLYADRPTETVAERAKTARALLLQIAAGKMRLDVAAAAAEESLQGLVEMVSGRRKSPFVG
ncbi:MAG: DUF1320 domain-containing protein [Azonexus sp.]